MRTYSFDTIANGYPELLSDAVDRGVPLNSRVGEVYEIEDVVFKLEDPFYTPAKRSGAATLIGMCEGVQLVGSTSTDGLMRELFPAMTKHTDFSGTYGSRMANSAQLKKIFDLLKSDHDTRRAVVTPWIPSEDAGRDGLDLPCTIGIGFRVRNGCLNMSVTMRSNDAWLGTYGDVIQFSLLQLTLAEALGLDVGTYVHHAQSFHVYQRDLDAIEKYVSSIGTIESDVLSPLSQPGWSYEDIASEAITVLGEPADFTPKTEMGKFIQTSIADRRAKMTSRV